MKTLKFIPLMALAATFAFVSCNGHAKKEAKEKETMDTVKIDEIEDVSVVDIVKPSDEYFAAAITAFDKKDNAAAAKEIREGIAAFKKETENEIGENKTLANAALKDLEGLDVKVEKGEIKNRADLDYAIYKLQAYNTHHVFVFVDDILVPVSDSRYTTAKANFTKGMESMRQLEKSTAKDKAKFWNEESKEVIKKGEIIEAKLKKDEKIAENEIKEFKVSLEKWYKKYFHNVNPGASSN